MIPFHAMAGLANSTPTVQYKNIDDTEAIFASYVSSFYTVKEPTTIVLICIYVPVFLVAFVGNALLLAIVLPHRSLWGVTSSFLVNLALADLLVAVVCIPMTVAEKVYRLWVYGEAMCKAANFLQGVSVTASTFTLAVMSMDRCLAIRHPMKCRSIRTSGHVRTLLIFIWIVSGLVMSPLLFLRKTESHEILPSKFITYCVEKWPSVETRQIYDVALLIILYAIPGTIVIVSYSLMGRRLWTPDKTLENSRRQNSTCLKNKPVDSIMTGRRNLARMLIVMASLFAACWLPYYIITTYAGFATTDDTFSALDLLSFSLVLGHVNSAVNPILYSFMNKTFRKYMKRMLTCRTRNRKSAGNEKGFLLAQMSWKTKSVRSTFVSSLRARKSSSTASTSQNSPKRSTSLTRNSRNGGYGTIVNGHALRGYSNDSTKVVWADRKRNTKAKAYSSDVLRNFDEGLNIPTTIGEELSENTKTSPSSQNDLSLLCANKPEGQYDSICRSDFTSPHETSTSCEIHNNTHMEELPPETSRVCEMECYDHGCTSDCCLNSERKNFTDAKRKSLNSELQEGFTQVTAQLSPSVCESFIDVAKVELSRSFSMQETTQDLENCEVHVNPLAEL